jgi:Co/Zn/Cd efflux system component
MTDRSRSGISSGIQYVGYWLLGVLLFFSLLLLIGLFQGFISPQYINSLSTILLVSVTGIYAFLTWLLVIENRRARREQRAPSFSIDTDLFGPRIKNIGNGPAVDLEVEFALTSEEQRTETVISRDNLIPGDTVWIAKEPFAAVTDEKSDISDKFSKIEISINYSDMFGKPGSCYLEYEIKELLTEKTMRSEEQQIANNLEKINTTLDRLLDQESIEQDQE